VVTDQYIRLTPDRQSRVGMLWNTEPLDLPAFEVVMGFRAHSQSGYGADGMALWIVDEVPENDGPLFGHPMHFVGIGVLFDSYDNDRYRDNPAVHILYNPHGTQNRDYNPQQDFRGQQAGNCYFDYRNTAKLMLATVRLRLRERTLEVYLSKNSEKDEILCATIQNVELNPTDTFFVGVTAETGGISDHHDVHFIHTYPIEDVQYDHNVYVHEPFSHNNEAESKQYWKAKTPEELALEEEEKRVQAEAQREEAARRRRAAEEANRLNEERRQQEKAKKEEEERKAAEQTKRQEEEAAQQRASAAAAEEAKKQAAELARKHVEQQEAVKRHQQQQQAAKEQTAASEEAKKAAAAAVAAAAAEAAKRAANPQQPRPANPNVNVPTNHQANAAAEAARQAEVAKQAAAAEAAKRAEAAKQAAAIEAAKQADAAKKAAALRAAAEKAAALKAAAERAEAELAAQLEADSQPSDEADDDNQQPDDNDNQGEYAAHEEQDEDTDGVQAVESEPNIVATDESSAGGEEAPRHRRRVVKNTAASNRAPHRRPVKRG
jgi:mannose-binding lectin 1